MAKKPSHEDLMDTILAMLFAARGSECEIDALKAEVNACSSRPSEYVAFKINELKEAIRYLLSNPTCTCKDHDYNLQQQTCSCGYDKRLQEILNLIK